MHHARTQCIRQSGLCLQSQLNAEAFALFQAGNDFRAYEKLGAHLQSVDGVPGAQFAVWAPHAQRVQLIGDFNA